MEDYDGDFDEFIDEHIVDINALSQEGLVVASHLLPEELPLIPVRPRPAFPGLMIPMALNDPIQVATFHSAMKKSEQTLGLVLVRDMDAEDTAENLHSVGVVGKIVKVLSADEESVHFLINCMERFTLDHLTSRKEVLIGRVTYHLASELSENQELKAYSMAILTTLKELIQINPLYSEEIKLFLNRSSLDDSGRLADFAANLTSSDGQKLQSILEAFDVRKRIDQVLVLLKNELEVSRLQTRISKQIEDKMSGQQREFFCANSSRRSSRSWGSKKRENGRN